MSGFTKQSAGALFWGVAVLCILWNAVGCYMYYLDMTLSDAAYTEGYGQAMTDMRDHVPTWSTASYAIAVWVGLVASISLLFRKQFAVTLFMISLIAAILSFAWGLLNADMRAATGAMGWVMPIIVVGLGCLEIWWSRKKVSDGTLS